jgi:hypothetical protein
MQDPQKQDSFHAIAKAKDIGTKTLTSTPLNGAQISAGKNPFTLPVKVE